MLNKANILKLADSIERCGVAGSPNASIPARMAHHAALLAGLDDPTNPVWDRRATSADVSVAIQRWLGLDDAAALSLFTPQWLQDRVHARHINVAWAIRCLRRLAETGRTEWRETKTVRRKGY